MTELPSTVRANMSVVFSLSFMSCLSSLLRIDTYFSEYFPKRIENLVQKQSQFLLETQWPGEQMQFLGQKFLF